jgi:hypothetical protein
VRIERLLAAGASIKGAARKFAIDYHALRRHWRNHVSAEARSAHMAGAGATKDQLEEIVAACLPTVRCSGTVLMIRKTRSASFLDAPPPRQATERELGDTRTSGNGREQRDRKAPKITVKSAPGKPLNIDMQPIDAVRLMSAFGTAEPGFATLMLSGIINAACGGGPSHPPGSGEINDALAAVTGIGARDETEGMLATQIIATHFAAISALRRLKGSETVPQQDSNGNLAIKLLRTFTMQVEALHRYRGKGQQKVTVEHVHVNAGGQAIVGTVHPPDVKKKWKEPDAPREITQGQDTPLRSPDPEREPVPIASGARQTPL